MPANAVGDDALAVAVAMALLVGVAK